MQTGQSSENVAKTATMTAQHIAQTVAGDSGALIVAPTTQTSSQETITSAKAIDTPTETARSIPAIEIASTSSTACFLGIATEVRCMIYNHLWTKNVDVCMMHKDIRARSPIHPIFQTNRQVRLEAADSLNKDSSVTLHLYAVVENFWLPESHEIAQEAGYQVLQQWWQKTAACAIQNMREDILALHIEPGTLGKMFAFMKNNGIAWRYRFEKTNQTTTQMFGFRWRHGSMIWLVVWKEICARKFGACTIRLRELVNARP